jgi:hypothetical protein
LILAQLGIGCILVPQDVRVAEFVNADGFHRSWKLYIFWQPEPPWDKPAGIEPSPFLAES